MARRLGATHVLQVGQCDVVGEVRRLTGGRGADSVIEAVGVPASFESCQDIVAPGGAIANIGVHGCKADLHLERLWSSNITIATRLVDTVTTPALLKILEAEQLNPRDLVTHRFPFDAILEAYEVFGHASESGALKVIVEM
jgi:alcohol dehydrogenase